MGPFKIAKRMLLLIQKFSMFLEECLILRDDRWILKWLLEHADTTDKEWIEIINMKYAKTQLRHGLKVRNHALVRNILQNNYKQSKWAVS